jgi:hypothetical protein
MKSHHPNYEIENYCVKCDIKYSKTVVWCTTCGLKVRTVPHSGARKLKYLRNKPRI